MHFKQASQPKVVRITRELADQHLQLPKINTDRKVSPFRVERWVSEISKGTMRPVLWARAICLEDGQTYRMNGQHTATAYATIDRIPDSAYAIIEDYICDTREDLPRLWQTFDSALSSRSSMDIANAYRSIDDVMASIPARLLVVVASAIELANGNAFLHFGRAGGFRAPAQDRLDRAMAHRDFIVWLDSFLCRVTHPHIHRVGVVAAIFSSWQRCQRDCKEFWTEVRDECNPDIHSASRRTAKWLMQNCARRRINPAVSREEYVRCLLWWNAYRTGGSVDIRYSANMKTPAVA
jgi:hypothetical protein